MLHLDNSTNTINIMETVGVIFVLVALGLLVLQILMIAKFFQIASDVNAIKSWLTEQPKTKQTSIPQNMDAVHAGSTVVEESTMNSENECGYIQAGETITFNDGLSGKIQKRFGEWWIYTDRGNQSFADKETAIQRHKDLLEQKK